MVTQTYLKVFMVFGGAQPKVDCQLYTSNVSLFLSKSIIEYEFASVAVEVSASHFIQAIQNRKNCVVEFQPNKIRMICCEGFLFQSGLFFRR